MRLGTYEVCLGTPCTNETACCGACSLYVVFGEPDCPFEESKAWWRYLLDPRTGNAIRCQGDGCTMAHPPVDLLGPKVEFESGAQYTVRGALVVFWSRHVEGSANSVGLLLDSVSKIGPRCSQVTDRGLSLAAPLVGTLSGLP